ncbi:MAG: hypothetical protein AAF802_32495 [Planctomycetota bacterium]
MDKQSRVANRQAWVERLERFKQADQSVAQFCAGEGISVPSFYQWRRKLDPRPETQRQASAKFIPVQLPLPPASDPETVLSVELPGGVSLKLEVRNAKSP